MIKILASTILLSASLFASSEITTKQAVELYKKKVKFLDVRNKKESSTSKIHGAAVFNLEAITEKSSFLIGMKQETIIVYDNGLPSTKATQAIDKLKSYGFKSLYYLKDGFAKWKASGYPVE